MELQNKSSTEPKMFHNVI